MKRDKIIYYVATALLTLLMLFSVSIYFFTYEDTKMAFESFGYPIYIIYPLAILKLIGLAVIWMPGLKNLKEWAYSGFFFTVILAFFAHYMIGDGEEIAAVIALVLLLTSYVFHKRLN